VGVILSGATGTAGPASQAWIVQNNQVTGVKYSDLWSKKQRREAGGISTASIAGSLDEVPWPLITLGSQIA
jgi:hypothetical protein